MTLAMVRRIKYPTVPFCITYQRYIRRGVFFIESNDCARVRSQHLYDLDSGNESKRSAGYGKDAVRRRHPYEKFRNINVTNVRKIKNNSQTLSFLRRQE